MQSFSRAIFGSLALGAVFFLGFYKISPAVLDAGEMKSIVGAGCNCFCQTSTQSCPYLSFGVSDGCGTTNVFDSQGLFQDNNCSAGAIYDGCAVGGLCPAGDNDTCKGHC
jgi:hypothetical protein